MNELIEKLARDAGAAAQASHGDEWWELDDDALEAFAKAVARECAEIVKTYGYDLLIKERFGL